MSFTEFDARIQGAKRAVVWPTVAGANILALLIASPQTGHVMFVDLLARVSDSYSLDLGDIGPRSVAFDAGREQGWIYCDTGWLLRVQAVIRNRRVELDVLDRERISDSIPGGRANWAVFAYSQVETGRRIAAGRIPLPMTLTPSPFLNGTSSYLHREENTEQRIIDVRSNRVIICPIGTGTVAAYNTVDTGVIEYARLSGLTPNVEAGCFNTATGYLYVADSGGRGAIVRLNPNNSLEMRAEFTFADVQGPVSAQIIDGKLVICCERRNRAITWDLTDPEAPVLESDQTFDTGLYWERNPVRYVAEDGEIIRKFGSLTTLLDHGDYPVEEAGEIIYSPETAFGWALHGEIAALTYTLFVEPAVSEAVPPGVYPSGYGDSGGVSDYPDSPPDLGRYTYVIGGSVAGGAFESNYTFPGIPGAKYRIRLRLRGRTEPKELLNTGGASPITAVGALEIAAGYRQIPQLAPVPNVRWGTWTETGSTSIDVTKLTIGQLGEDCFCELYVAANEEADTTLPAYRRAGRACRIDNLMELEVLGGQNIKLRIDYGDSATRYPAKSYADDVSSNINVNPNNAELMPPDDDAVFPLCIPWIPRFPDAVTQLNPFRYHFIQIDITHVQRAPGY